ncbi:MAG: hypothetical protein IVW54_07805, partial [Candidatus Binataceae bacterium]|nr:hypothetical protein [Candidatus Binataceae bacterium]
MGRLVGYVLALAVLAVPMAYAPSAYAQAQSTAAQNQSSLMDTIVKGGPSGAWIPHPENPWLQGLRITGLLQNTSGMWVNPHG